MLGHLNAFWIFGPKSSYFLKQSMFEASEVLQQAEETKKIQSMLFDWQYSSISKA